MKIWVLKSQVWQTKREAVSYTHLDVYKRQDVAFALNNLNMNKDEVKNIVYDILNKLGIYQLKDKAVYKLSGGEKRSACIASILVQNPNIILFDEPTSYLDRKSKRKLIEIINTIN